MRTSERQAPQNPPELDSMGSLGKRVGAAVGSVRGARAIGQREGGTSRGQICRMLVLTAKLTKIRGKINKTKPEGEPEETLRKGEARRFTGNPQWG